MVDRPLVLGHPGASHARPENTLAAFAHARQLGADRVELDARPTGAAQPGHAWLNPDRAAALRAPPDALADAQRSGLRVNVWTVDEPGEITTLAAAGVDAIITDVPGVALDALGRTRL